MSLSPREVLKATLNDNKTTHIKLLGDSITHGMGGTGYKPDGYSFVKGFSRNSEGYCWANNFKKYMEHNFNCTVTNNGCSGTNILFVLDNLDRLVDANDDLIFCTIGTNNRHRPFSMGEKPTREALGTEFYHNILKLYDKFKALNKKVIFIANIPASAQNEQDGADFWRILHMDDINNIYKAAAQKCDFPLISLYDLFVEYCKVSSVTVDSLLRDGLHPNDEGYDVMLKLLLQTLEIN